MLEILFAEIPAEGLAVEVDDTSWFPELEVTRSGALRAEVFLERSGARVLVHGNINVSLVQVCDRCLEEVVQPRDIDLRLVLELAQDAEGQADETGGEVVGRGETEVVLVERPVVDLADLLGQQLILALPRKNLCRPDCLGLCEHCGANLNQEGCGCAKKSVISPFGALGRLVKDKK